ncbi:tetratricopeptide repeat protein [Paractinoplanes rishiriensis]|uniref:Tetratricopeptide repeat protein n=1 Tax=Paractinoplanes rishiriensis TaxID=1050105 RepID=A0A919JSN3_9ACTN|nr:tetratricopeptide repeat protein [Actinoplanes rishiriensis]GIE94441.1 hypothetical protein Ari01nite_19060 [Actinoplanes rishiriensis]
MFALQLRLWRHHCGQPPSPIPDQLDWTLVEGFLRTCHATAEEPPDLDLAYWRREFERTRTAPVEPPRWIGPIPPVAEAYQPRTVPTAPRTVLSGPAGTGKTQLAAALAQDAELVIWITANSRANIISTYATTSRELSAGNPDDPVEAAHQLPAHLSRSERRWLVVLDDVRDVADLDGLWPPEAPGRTVVTTRLPLPAAQRTGPFTPTESLTYLTDRLATTPPATAATSPTPTGTATPAGQHRLDGAADLATALGHLPLALAQAAAVILDRDLTCRTYLARLRALPEASPGALALDAADAREPAGVARPVLEVAARLDPAGAPAAALTAPALLDLVTTRRGTATTAADLAAGLAALQLTGLCRPDRAGETIHLPEPVHEAVRTAEPDKTGDLTRCAADCLLAIWPAVEGDTAQVDLLRRNTRALLDDGVEALCTDRLHPLVFRAGNSLPQMGLFDAAVGYWSGLRPVVERCLGAEHEDTLTVRNNLAWAYGRAGAPEQALAELRDLLPVRTRVLGPDAVNTLATRHGIAVWLDATGDTGQAVHQLRALIADYERVLGRAARDTVNTRITLAGHLGATESPAVAVAHLTALLDEFRRVPGVSGHELLDAEYNLALWQAEAGALDDAIGRADHLAREYGRVLDPDHVDTLWARHLAAMLRAQAGHRRAAVEVLRSLADDVRRIEETGRADVIVVRDAIDGWAAAEEEREDQAAR